MRPRPERTSHERDDLEGVWLSQRPGLWRVLPYRDPDGTSLASHNALREVSPGRFKVVKPAAVELHTALDVLCDAPITVVLTPDTVSEQTFLPEPDTLTGCLLVADRGYSDLH